MADNLKKVLYNKSLEITFFVDDGVARVEYRSSDPEIDLSEPEDIILFVNGEPISVQSASEDEATAVIGDWAQYSGSPVKLMTRVGEFFDGWEFEP